MKNQIDDDKKNITSEEIKKNTSVETESEIEINKRGEEEPGDNGSGYDTRDPGK